MTAQGVLGLALVVLAGLLVGLVAVIAAVRAARTVVQRRLAAAQRALRPRVAAVLADVPDRDEPAPRGRHRRRLAAAGDPGRPADTGARPAGEPGADDPAGADGAADLAADRLHRLWAVGSRRHRRVLEATVYGYLGKVRGPARRSLVAFLHRTGTVARARRRARRPGLVGRARAAEVLGRVGGADAELVRLLADRQPVVRVVAVAGLAGATPTMPLVTALLASLDGARRVPPALVTETLVRLGPGAAPLLAAALDRPAGEVAAAGHAVAAEALGLLGTPDATRALLAVLTAPPRPDRPAGPDGDGEVRIRAARALGRIGAPAALDPLVRCLAPAEPPALRTVAARALGELGSPRAVPHLVPLLSGPHRLATNAASALAALGPAGRRTLTAAAGDPRSPAGRYAAAALATLELADPAGATVVPTLAG